MDGEGRGECRKGVQEGGAREPTEQRNLCNACMQQCLGYGYSTVCTAVHVHCDPIGFAWWRTCARTRRVAVEWKFS